MNKFVGKIGFAFSPAQSEAHSGIWKEKIVEKTYCGTMLRSSRVLENSSEVIEELRISNQLSILADPYANNNMYAMRYIRFRGVNWTIKSAEAGTNNKRIILTLGGIWNGAVAESN